MFTLILCFGNFDCGITIPKLCLPHGKDQTKTLIFKNLGPRTFSNSRNQN